MKTSELTGAALDWAVALCECGPAWRGEDVDPHFYSTDWSQGGPIIERENLAVTCCPQFWTAYSSKGTREVANFGPTFNWTGKATGPTPLIAAMRCYVASRLGDEVDLPEGLQQGEK